MPVIDSSVFSAKDQKQRNLSAGVMHRTLAFKVLWNIFEALKASWRGLKTEMAKINASDGNLCDREAAQAEAQTFNI